MAHGRNCFKDGDSSRKLRAIELKEDKGYKSTKMQQVKYRLKQVRGTLRRVMIKAKYRAPILAEQS